MIIITKTLRTLHLKYNNQHIKAEIQIPGSKSISNRLLVLKEVLALDIPIHNLSSAQDTVDLINALQLVKKKQGGTIDIGHAGTDMRFLTALLSITPGQWILTGSERMKERPVKPLVDALVKLGADISYEGKDGFPPLKINGKKLMGTKVEIDGSISSQFISALLLIAPSFENGLTIDVKGEIVSWPYIQMTLDFLTEFGLNVSTANQTISISKPNSALPLSTQFTVESDWSAASYWYSIVALSSNAQISLKSFSSSTSQGDSVLREIYKSFGVESTFKNGELTLTKKGNNSIQFEYDFTHCPDLAQTIAVTCLGLKIPCLLTGLSTLKLKETDRIQALKTELEKFGAEILITNQSLQINSFGSIPSHVSIATYNDHRMAMSFAPLSLIHNNISIQNPEVVKKSYPEFWSHLQKIGITSNS